MERSMASGNGARKGSIMVAEEVREPQVEGAISSWLHLKRLAELMREHRRKIMREQYLHTPPRSNFSRDGAGWGYQTRSGT